MPIIHSLREQAVSSVVQALYSRHPELAQRFGEQGMKACREDIYYHLDFLEGALVTGDAVLFSNYAIWLQELLNSRGVPSGSLAESLDLLSDFFRQNLAEVEAEPMCVVLAAARDALTREIFPLHSPSPYFSLSKSELPESIEYMDKALQGNNAAAQDLIYGLMDNAGLTLTEASVRVIQPACYEAGRLWQLNRITVAQEHIMTAVSQNVLARAYLHADFAAPVGRKAMFACVAGNRHSLGLRMISDAFESVGWLPSYLGADVPISDLVRQIDTERPDLLCLSLCLPIHLAVARETLERLRAELGTSCPPIWVGGNVTLMGERIWNSVKADGWAMDALHALKQVAP